ncbi:hypothetical protein MBAV_000195 [Candidatus Magnetobacterium bavaricum]|uniref:Uncharacterized protein n=1 Tax=Candidatus Magnetobacterium bavaricum TaxID=29290 RepID=A0A0F3H0C1_9BACT|nr:hypothetical protein MBAV_000195 [Candidatus Magnetobacterium bavaricum]
MFHSSGHHLLYEIAIEISTSYSGFVVVSLIPIDFYITWVCRSYNHLTNLSKINFTIKNSIKRLRLSTIIFIIIVVDK